MTGDQPQFSVLVRGVGRIVDDHVGECGASEQKTRGEQQKRSPAATFVVRSRRRIGTTPVFLERVATAMSVAAQLLEQLRRGDWQASRVDKMLLVVNEARMDTDRAPIE